MDEESLFNRYFINIPKLSDPEYDVVQFNYNEWVEWRKNFQILYGLFDYHFIKPIWENNFKKVINRNWQYKLNLLSKDNLEFLEFYNIHDKQHRLDHCLTNVITLMLENKIFAPVTVNFEFHLHPGQCLSYACKILQIPIPALFIKLKNKNYTEKQLKDFTLLKEINYLADLQNYCIGDINCYTVRRKDRYEKKYLQYDIDLQFINTGIYKTRDADGWIDYPDVDWELFWDRFTKVCSNFTKNLVEIKFFHINANKEIKIKIDKTISPSYYFKKMKIDDLLYFKK